MMKQTNNPVQDRGLRTMLLLDGMPDDLILSGKPETDPYAGEEKRENWFLRMMSSPAAAVVLSLCVAFGVLFAVIRAGQNGTAVTPAGSLPGTDRSDSASDGVPTEPTDSLFREGKIVRWFHSVQYYGRCVSETSDAGDKMYEVMELLDRMELLPTALYVDPDSGVAPMPDDGLPGFNLSFDLEFIYEDGTGLLISSYTEWLTVVYTSASDSSLTRNDRVYRISRADDAALRSLLESCIEMTEAPTHSPDTGIESETGTRYPDREFDYGEAVMLKNNLIPAGTILKVDVSTSPMDPNLTASWDAQTKLYALLHCLEELSLTPTDEQSYAAGMAWNLEFTYGDGSRLRLSLFDCLLTLWDSSGEMLARYRIPDEEWQQLNSALFTLLGYELPRLP